MPIDNAFTSAVIQKPLASVSLFDASQYFLPACTHNGKVSPDGEDCPATAFLSPSGQMGLIGKDGKEVTKRDGSPLRYTYIGPFIAGYARVCKGGKLVWRQNAGWVGRFRIHRLSTFAKDFNLRGTSNLDQNFSDTEYRGIYAMVLME
ncbi:MAG: WG repeat-containing protein [Lewinellaceae bacterium]|nr:WG repeat-containing protein [Lewinellaceae bacterium]